VPLKPLPHRLAQRFHVRQVVYRGADMPGKEWRDSGAARVIEFMAECDSLGKKAGPIRNQQMLDEGRKELRATRVVFPQFGCITFLPFPQRSSLTIFSLFLSLSEGTPYPPVRLDGIFLATV
jgi:hypothetical protein